MVLRRTSTWLEKRERGRNTHLLPIYSRRRTDVQKLTKSKIVDILTQFLNTQAAEEQLSHVTNLRAYLVQVATNYDFEVTSIREVGSRASAIKPGVVQTLTTSKIVDNLTEFMTTQTVGQQRTHANTSIRPWRLLALWASTVSTS
jgi:hypothetical protein